MKRGRAPGSGKGALALVIAVAVVAVGLGVLLTSTSPAAATPWTGPEPTPTNLKFYLHNSSTPVTVGAADYLLVMSTTNDSVAPWAHTGSLSVATHYDSVSFVAAPQLAAPLTLNGSVSSDVYMNQSGSSLSGGSVTLTISEVAPNGTTTALGTGTAIGTSLLGAGGSIPNLVALPGPTIHDTIPAEDSVAATITITGTSSTFYGIWWGNVSGSTYASSVDLPASTYLTASDPVVLNATGQPSTVLGQSTANKSLTISTVVADPLGAYDFSSFPVFFTVYNRTSIVYGPVAMNATGTVPIPAGAGNATYAIGFNYSVLGPGIYNFTVNATDNTEHNLANESTLPAYYGRIAIGTSAVVVGLAPVPVFVKVVDDHLHPLNRSVVRAFGGPNLLATNTTNSSGGAGFDLPNDSAIVFRVFWQNVAVGVFPENVTAPNETFQLNATVIYPTFELRTALGGYPVPYALVSILHPNGSEIPLLVSSGSGDFSLAQVPAGNYTMTVIYDDSEVVSDLVVAASSDGPIVVTVSGVYALSVSTVTGGGGALSGVFVSVVNASTGATIDSGVTNASGALSFLVPAGLYVVSGDWSATYDLTPLAQSVSEVVRVAGPTSTTLSFSTAYPAFTSTNEFYIVLGFAALAVVVGLLAILLLRRRKKEVPPLTPAPAISPPEAEQEKGAKP